MKKILKILGVILGILLILIVSTVIYINASGIPTYEKPEFNYTIESTPLKIERGKKLASIICANCHLNPKSGKLSGKLMSDAPKEFGTIYSANITNDQSHGIKDWTDGEIAYLLRTGIKRDGTYAPPYMAKFPTMADDDLESIIAFLRSDETLVSPDPSPTIPSDPSLLTKLLCRVAFVPFDLPTAPIEMPDTTNTIALGKYLATNLDCFSCHSADFTTNNFLEPEKSEGYYGGGNKPLNENGDVMITPNLTPHETGIGNWTKEQFLKAVKYGLKDGEEALRIPMAPYVHLTDYEINAIYDYLQTVPAIDNKVERSVLE